MADAPDLLERLRRYWAEQGLDTGAPQSESELTNREQHYGVVFPSDVRAYFEALNGMARHLEFHKEWDSELIRFFPLDEFRPLDEQWPGEQTPGVSDLFIFADYSISGWDYAVRMRGKGQGEVCVCYGEEIVPVTRTFSEFLERYLARDYSVTHPR
jgi:hypothetical protein